MCKIITEKGMDAARRYNGGLTVEEALARISATLYHVIYRDNKEEAEGETAYETAGCMD